MAEGIFLSASVPDPKRSAHHAETADTVAITAAVGALIHVVLGRRMLVWGGHPAITPMIWIIARDIGVDYGSWVRLYQSRYFEDQFPEDNVRFQNVIYTEDVRGDRELSLFNMRTRMFTENVLTAAVFIGGMSGVLDEFELFRRAQPHGKILPVASTGGAALEVASLVEDDLHDLASDLDYVALFHRSLDISVREQRFRTPDEQPVRLEDRFWHAL